MVDIESKEVALARNIAFKVADRGGRAYYVGGYVRDKYLGVENKDIDIEIHGIEPGLLCDILRKFGEVIYKGQSFGVYGIKGYDIDISLPRSEVSNGPGHKDFRVVVDPYIGVNGATRRRDFTINAMMIDVLDGRLIDIHNGLSDLGNGVIRHVDDKTFGDDPLRVLRACQFASRFGFKIAKETIEISKKMDVTNLSSERIHGEMLKALVKSKKPSIFFNELHKTGHLDYWFRELRSLKGMWQNPEHHPEGDVYTHTMMVLDEASKCNELWGNDASKKFRFMMAALCHDFGKARATDYDPITGKITSIGHEVAGVFDTISFMNGIRCSKYDIKYVTNMVENHMVLNRMVDESNKQSRYNHAFDKMCEPTDMIYLSMADAKGRGMEVDYSEEFTKLSSKLCNYRNMLATTEEVTGDDLISIGIPKGQIMGKLLERGHYLRLSGVRKEIILKELAKEFRKIVSKVSV